MNFGLIECADPNIIPATQGNAARMAMSVERAAKGLIHNGEVSDALLNMVEMAFRAYDPCLACATHALPGEVSLEITIRDKDKNIIDVIKRT